MHIIIPLKYFRIIYERNFMLIDTHVHLNMMVKKKFDTPLTSDDLKKAEEIIFQAEQNNVTQFINVGTSVIESFNSVELAKKITPVFASIGIHPNDCTQEWLTDFEAIKEMLKKNKEYIVAIGECGLDKHYPGYNLPRQKDAFRAHIELALEHNLPLIIHTRDAGDETLTVLDEYSKENLSGVIHCFSEDQSFADHAIDLGFVLGIGGTITYPKNEYRRDIVKNISLNTIILETDAPFLPPQIIRGKQNHPKYIKVIAEYIANLRNEPFEKIAHQTTENVRRIFNM